MGLELNSKSVAFKVIIAGTRTFQDYGFLCTKMDILLANKKEVEIVSGTTNGADILGEKYAASKLYPVAYFPADWVKLGNAAGPIRNTQMANYADVLVAFLDGKSAGTKNMIETMKKLDKPVRVYQSSFKSIEWAVNLANAAGFDLEQVK